MPKKGKGSNFEESLEKLEALVEKLERGELSLEESLKAFEEGMALSKGCEESLQAAQKKIEKLTRKDDGALQAEPFDLPEDD